MPPWRMRLRHSGSGPRRSPAHAVERTADAQTTAERIERKIDAQLKDMPPGQAFDKIASIIDGADDFQLRVLAEHADTLAERHHVPLDSIQTALAAKIPVAATAAAEAKAKARKLAALKRNQQSLCRASPTSTPIPPVTPLLDPAQFA